MEKEEDEPIIEIHDVDSSQIIEKRKLSQKQKIIIFSILGITIGIILLIVILLIV